MHKIGRVKLALVLLISLIPGLSFATPYYGATLSYAAYSTEPSHLRGFQFMVNYDPQRFKWRAFNLYFDGGFSRFWDNTANAYSSLNIYSAAPVIRYTFKKRGPVLPFLELSIGLAYLNETRISNRNLGIHFSFQDRMGIGALLGTSEQVSIGVHAVHYSNAHLASHNSGISIPLVLDVGYRFQ